MALDWFYEDIVTITSSFSATKREFGFLAENIKLAATTGDVDFSFDGATLAGTIKPSDGAQNFNSMARGKIYIRAAGSGTLRVWAWNNG